MLRIALSATAGEVPSSTASVTSPIKRVSKRLTTKPGASLQIIIVFFNSLPTPTAVAVVASSVVEVRAISRSGITATGLKKWKPITRSGLVRPSVILSTESDEVFVARTHSGEMIFSNFLNSSCLRDSSSKIASIIKSQPANEF